MTRFLQQLIIIYVPLHGQKKIPKTQVTVLVRCRVIPARNEALNMWHFHQVTEVTTNILIS